MTPQAETPLGLALIVCDTLIEDRFTGKKSLVGLFEGLHAASFPCMHPAMSILVELTNVSGKQTCRLLCKHDDGETVAFEARGDLNCPDPGKVVQIAFGFRSVRFPKPGIYWLNFLVDDLPVMSRPLAILQRAPQPPQQAAPTPPPAAE